MTPGIQVECLWDDVDMLKVRISASNGSFAGSAQMYVEIGALAKAADNLTGFPQNSSDAREFQFGEFGPKWHGGAAKLKFYCDDGAGHAFAEAMCEAGELSGKTVQSARVSIAIEASAVDEFVSALRELEAKKRGTALLRTNSN